MVDNIKSRSAFIYLEDHKLIKDRKIFKQILFDFDNLRLDYLCYSWFFFPQLINNILLLSPIHNDNLAYFDLDKSKFKN